MLFTFFLNGTKKINFFFSIGLVEKLASFFFKLIVVKVPTKVLKNYKKKKWEKWCICQPKDLSYSVSVNIKDFNNVFATQLSKPLKIYIGAN